MILPYFSDEEHDGPSSTSPNQLTSEQIRTTLSPAAEEKNVKLIVRHQHMHFKSPLRSQMWKALYLRMEGKFFLFIFLEKFNFSQFFFKFQVLPETLLMP